ncbi:Zn(2)-C6 fungal-type domain-containing protein [Mycena sanguinolenta]|uniref:Zn(2)-C6 fungal-type domain-containing protein n=1 Tax=Mycena sanguinolenta TaxID=230812 RepID=A0A8H6ZBB1_9AGAR|nr:Zn(2)-C6 fungal-type domain-containing protein [Mycena sanguinolenta]
MKQITPEDGSPTLDKTMTITWRGDTATPLSLIYANLNVFRVQRQQANSVSELQAFEDCESNGIWSDQLSFEFLFKRCDGARPVCGPCTRVPKDDPCEFTDGYSRTKELQATIQRLKARVKELESPGGSLPPVMLTRPDSAAGPMASSSSSNWERRSPPSPGSDSAGGSSFVSSPDSDHSLLGVQEPPFAMIQMLLVFSCILAAFAHLPCFSYRLVIRRGHRLLYYVLHIYGAFISPARNLWYPTRPSSSGVHSNIFPLNYRKVPILSTEFTQFRRTSSLQTIFLRNKQFLEAEFHTNGSVTLALGYHLHKIRSSRPSSPPLIGATAFAEVFPDPPRDDIEEGERIRGFWTVVCNQNNMIMTLRTANNMGILDSPNMSIDTPWPLDIEEYELGMLPRDLRGSDTVRNFVMDAMPGPNSIFALKIQATVLLQQAIQLARKWTPVMQPQAAAAHMNASSWLDARIQQFTAGVPLLHEYYDRGADARTLAVTHALLGAASIQLHKNNADGSGTSCIDAARTIIVALGDINVSNFQCGGPAVGTLLLLACQVVIREIERTRYFRASLGSTLNVEVVSNQEEAGLLLDLQNGLTTMAIYAMDSPLVQFQLGKIQQKCDTLGL